MAHDPWHVANAQKTYDELCDFADGLPVMTSKRASELIEASRPEPTIGRPDHAHGPAWCMLGRCPTWDELRVRVQARLVR